MSIYRGNAIAAVTRSAAPAKAAHNEQSTDQRAVWLYHLFKINFSTHHYLVT